MRAWWIAPACVGAAACMMTPAQRREDTLVREARQFNDDLRWARWEVMRQAMLPEEGPLFAARADAVADELEMADSDVTQITFGQPSETATVTVKLSWYTKRDPIVRNTTLEQKWALQNGRWLMVKQRRLKGDRFPLVTEPLAPAAP